MPKELAPRNPLFYLQHYLPAVMWQIKNIILRFRALGYLSGQCSTLGHDAGSYGHGATTKPTLSCDRLSLGLEASGHVLSSGAHGRIDLHLSGFLRVPGEQTRVTRFFLEVSALRKCLALKSCTGQTGFSGTSYSN